MERAWTLKLQQETLQTRVCSGSLGQGPRAAVWFHAVWRGLSAGGIGHCRPVSVRFLAEAGGFQLDVWPFSLPPCSSTSPRPRVLSFSSWFVCWTAVPGERGTVGTRRGMFSERVQLRDQNSHQGRVYRSGKSILQQTRTFL